MTPLSLPHHLLSADQLTADDLLGLFNATQRLLSTHCPPVPATHTTPCKPPEAAVACLYETPPEPA
ncbi:MAG: hypothetical protein U0003_01390 [Vampirovibrionales bacterium]